MSENERLVHAYRCKTTQKGADWGYDWSKAEYSTGRPTPRDNDTTMFFTCNHSDSDPVEDLETFFQHVNRNKGKALRAGKLVLVRGDNDDGLTNTSTGERKQTITVQQGGKDVLWGFVTIPTAHLGSSIAYADSNIGNYAVLEAKSTEGMYLLRFFQTCVTHGYCAIVDHSEVEFGLPHGCLLKAVSGRGPLTEEDAGDLATRFSLLDASQNEVARCHLSYRGGLRDPSVGPTIEKMEVHRDFRGKGFLPVLWYWVLSFIQENITLECMSTDCSPGHVMVKVVSLKNVEVDRQGSISVTDKDFFFDHAGFSVFSQQSINASGTCLDNEGRCYIPLLSRDEIKARASSFVVPESNWSKNRGNRPCDACGRRGTNHSRCGRCRTAFYCSKPCQKRDWTKGFHKAWCGKTREELASMLKERGVAI